MVQSREGSNLDIFNRIGARWAKCRQASGVICDKRVSHRLKRIFYKTIIRPAMLCRTDRIRNDHFSDTLKVAPTNDKMRETCLKWFCYVSRRPETTSLCRVEMLRIRGTRRRDRPLKLWRKELMKDR